MPVLEDIAYATWNSRSPRTLLANGGVAATPTYLTQIASQVWSYSNRTLTRPYNARQATIPADFSSTSIDMASPVNWSSPLTKGLVSWWLCLPGQGGAKLRDLCKNYDGALTANSTQPKWSSAKTNTSFNSLNFNADGEIRLTGGPPKLRFANTDKFSIVVLANPTISQLSDIVRVDGTGYYRLSYDSTGAAGTNIFWGDYYDGTILRRARSLAVAPPGNFYHVVLTHDGSNTAAGMTFYVNGKSSVGTTNAGTPSSITYADSNTYRVVYNTFTGYFVTAMIYNRQLSRDDVSLLYKESNLLYPSMLRRTRPAITRVFVPGPAVLPRPVGRSVSLTAGHQINRTHPLLKGMVRWWIAVPGKTQQQISWTDVLGKGNVTLNNGPFFTNSNPRPGNPSSISFDGSNDTGTTGSQVSGTHPLTMSCWIRPGSLAADKVVFWNGNVSPTWDAWYIAISTTGVVTCNTVQANTFRTASSAAGSVAVNKWAMLTAVFASPTSRKLYINGTLVASDTASATPAIGSGDTVLGGHRVSGGGSNNYNGQADSFQIWQRSLSDDEVRTLYQDSVLGHPEMLHVSPPSFFAPTDTRVIPRRGLPGPIDAVSPLNRSHPLARGLVGFWLATPDQKGAKWRDIAGINDAVVGGSAAWTSSKNGPCLNLDGVDDYAAATRPVAPTGSSARTFAVWFMQRTIVNNVNSAMVEQTNGGSGQGFLIQLAQVAGSYYLFTDTVNSSNNITISGSEIPSLMNWHMLVFSFNGSGWSYYLDGKFIRSASFVTSINTATPGLLQFGRRTTGSTGYFDGLIASVMAYNRALSAAEVAQLYKESSLGYPELLSRKSWTGLPYADASTGGGSTISGASSLYLYILSQLAGNRLTGGTIASSCVILNNPLGSYLTSSTISASAEILSTIVGIRTLLGSASLSNEILSSIIGTYLAGGQSATTNEILSSIVSQYVAGGRVSTNQEIISGLLGTYLAKGAVASSLAINNSDFGTILSGGRSAAALSVSATILAELIASGQMQNVSLVINSVLTGRLVGGGIVDAATATTAEILMSPAGRILFKGMVSTISEITSSTFGGLIKSCASSLTTEIISQLMGRLIGHSPASNELHINTSLAGKGVFGGRSATNAEIQSALRGIYIGRGASSNNLAINVQPTPLKTLFGSSYLDIVAQAAMAGTYTAGGLLSVNNEILFAGAPKITAGGKSLSLMELLLLCDGSFASQVVRVILDYIVQMNTQNDFTVKLNDVNEFDTVIV